ncbi:MAG: PAS domain S-box protein, partial [Planctomycetaceae bacterium]|nr:PAS domain S-box protein [Planctomycetaceae bacterium]
LGNRLLVQQEATRQERDFNESLVETASSIILLLDTNARILFFNQSTADLLEHSFEELKGKDWFDVCVPEPDRARGRAVFAHCLKNGLARESQFAVMARDGRTYQFSWSTKPMRDTDNQISQLLFVGQDVTSLLETQNRLVSAERLAAIGQTIAAVSHESRNELMALKMGLEMLSMTVTEASTKQLIGHLQNSQTRLDRLLEDVRHYAGPMHLERSVCSLQSIWRRAWDSLEATWRDRETELQETIDCETLHCSVDALRLEQVFRNLFENSLASCSDPVWIEVRASLENKDDRPFLRLSVRDNGPGLSPEAKAKVFEPFFTTKQRGTGLGMAISQRILKAHNGSLSLADHTGRGAEFLLELPLDTSSLPTTSDYKEMTDPTDHHPKVLK